MPCSCGVGKTPTLVRETAVSLTPKDAVLFDLYTSLAERIAVGARMSVEMISGGKDERKDLSKRIGAIESEADE